MKKKRKGTFFSTKGKISTGDWGKICGDEYDLSLTITSIKNKKY